MCSECEDFLHLLQNYEARVTGSDGKHSALLKLVKNEFEVAVNYVQTWPNRQCMCIYRDVKNFDKFNLVVQSLICLVIHFLKNIRELIDDFKNTSQTVEPKDSPKPSTSSATTQTSESPTEEKWTIQELEKLIFFVSKAFLLNFPLYVAYKHGIHSRLDEIQQEEAKHLAIFCDLHDNEIPVYLLRNVSLFCNSSGFLAMMTALENSDLPITTSHAITITISNVKLWLNYRCIIQFFVPIRSKILQYLCKLSDQDLRSSIAKSMADFVWLSGRDPLDSSFNFDIEGLELAFKYFNSTTLTMRLAGMAQINTHINLFNEICTTETVGEIEIVGQKLGDWLTENQIIEHLFGPNLHVEVVKQSQVVLNFLAVENQITEDHLNLIWQAAQLKHCSKPIYDILPSLVKNLAARPSMHLYSLLCKLDAKEHTEQSIFIASALIKLIWTRDCGSIVKLANETNATASSSESVSMDGSITEEENPDDSGSSRNGMPIDVDVTGGVSDSGAPPCKQARKKKSSVSPGEIPKQAIKSQDEKMVSGVKLQDRRIMKKNRSQPASSSDEDDEDEDDEDDIEDLTDAQGQLISNVKKVRKRKNIERMFGVGKINAEMADVLWGDSHSDGEAINDSDDQVHNSVMKHLPVEGPYVRLLTNSAITDFLNDQDNDNGSYSSPMSNKSEKNMADFDDDDSPCEEEIAQLVESSGIIPKYNAFTALREKQQQERKEKELEECIGKIDPNGLPVFRVSEVCQPGKTLLWDLLQDNKIGQLGEALAIEAEKALGTLLCFSTDKTLRSVFIQGCLQNLATNKSVIVSLRLLPKLFASFQQFRTGGTYEITLWAERQHKMMFHFFNNIKYYASIYKNSEKLVLNANGQPMYSHMTQVSVRLQFLSSVYSSLGSPKPFRLSLDQVDALWEWLAHDPECADCLFAWLQCQAKGIDQHALDVGALQHIYLKKLPEVQPEEFTMIALGLFQQLCSLARIAIHNDQTVIACSANITGMDHLWKIALRAHNTEVSLAAIQYINSFYMGQKLRFEHEFVSTCMDHLIQAAEDLQKQEKQEYALMCVQRGLMLLNTHLETFRRRYAFHIRRWAMEGKEIGTFSNLRNESQGPTIRIILQPAGLSEKSVLHLHANDLVAELKAEISKWWENLQGESQSTSNTGVQAPVLGYLLSEGPLRIITQGQELTSDYDDRPLGEVGFKDNQIVYVSLGGRGARRKEPSDHPTLQPPPSRENLPTVLLLQPCYFEELFNLMQILGDMRSKGKANTKAQLFSRRVWDILAILPTNPNMMQAFKDLENDIKYIDDGTDEEKQAVKNNLNRLLCPTSLQKFMYSLHIVENLATKNTKNMNVKNKIRLNSKKNESDQMKITEIMDSKDDEIKEDEEVPQQQEVSTSSTMLASVEWSEVFIKIGGVKHLYEIFLSGVLQSSSHPDDKYNEWRHDCLGCMLRIIYILGFHETRPDDLTLVIAKPYDFMLNMMDVPTCLKQLSSILNDEANYHHINQLQLRTGFWARAQVIQYVMSILVSFVHFCNDAQKILWTKTEYYDWLQKFILDDPEPSVRREICAGLYRISLGNSNKNNYELLTPLLQKLVIFLDVAEKMTIQHQSTHLVSDECKEPYGPACRDYFWLLARLVDTLTPKLVKESLENPQGSALDIEKLCFYVSRSILNRDYYEAKYGFTDDGLIGLLNLLSNLIKYDPPFKFSPEALNLLENLFKFLFELPSPQNREKPKCKSQTSRAAAYDLIVELCKNSPSNFKYLHTKLLEQHRPGPHAPYPWDYWPRDDVRSDCGYVGLTNLGATCYMASCIQHLFMMPQAREAVLKVPPEASQKHTATLHELQRMFAYLAESERKSYNPRSFCRVYQMDHQPLNTGEQKDMAEFFIDLVSKLEEMTPDLKVLIKRLFCGTLSNNVVSLDCEHVSQTGEEFYTVRCQVADMRNLQESLDEVTVKDTLEGDNMYTCSQCGKKVRAEKRACFKKLPQILAFNTMRYTFNMVTMLKEKVNTHFSFPMRLDMSAYVEKTLMPNKNLDKGDEDKEKGCETKTDEEDIFSECYEYELVGVTVHTGTADGGHYYSFIKERYENSNHKERWFLFNDAEVKPFDPAQIAAECFGGEMTSKTYDSVTEKYLDFSFEKTNSAYMLFYERRVPDHIKSRLQNASKSKEDKIPVPSTSKESSIEMENIEPNSSNKCDIDSKNSFKSPSSPAIPSTAAAAQNLPNFPIRRNLLNKSLEEWIWQDNRNFLQDRNIFEHTYFNFMWQICGHVPQTLLLQTDVTCLAAQLSISFFIETFIHAKEKPTMVLWVEHLTKQFNASQEACEWFLTHMSTEPWWPLQVLIQCPNQMVRQMFQRLVIHVIQRLRPNHFALYLQPEAEEGDDHDAEIVGNASCITRFIKSLILLMEHGAKAHLRHLSEFFGLLFEFSRMGDEETLFLLRINIIKSIADFYLGHKSADNNESNSDNEDNSSDEAVPIDKTRPASLDKMIALVATLVERSRGPDFRLHLSPKDYNAIAGGKGFPFLYQQIKDNINPHQSRNLIHALCRWDERLANQIITMLFASVIKHTELCGPFFKLLSLLTESQVGPSGLPCFSQLVLQRIWEAAEYCPQSALDWLATQAPRNKVAHAWIFQSAENWVENFLMAHNNSRVRNAAAYLLVSLVPSQSFRASFRNHNLHKINNNAQRELSNDAQIVLHNIITILLRLLRAARAFTDIGIHGTTKLTSYFNLLTYCMISKTEKIMVGPYMRCLWDLFHPRLSEPSVPAHHNKHALLTFWYHVTNDCTENATIITNSPEITKNIAFNYILADHDDGEIVTYNRAMLPAYYGLLRVCCQQSRALTRQLAAHQNLQWAFKNITPHPTQYPAAVEELFKLMSLFAERHPEASEVEQQEINNFRRTTLSAYLAGLDARVSWSTLINALKILVDNDEDRLFVVYNGGIEMCFDALHTLHSMFHEATACHVNGDLMELLSEMLPLISALRVEILNDSKSKNRKSIVLKGLSDALKRLATFLNTFNPPELRHLAVEVLKELVRTPTLDAIQILYPLFTHSHYLAQNSPTSIGPLGPFFPRPGIKISHYNFGKNEPRPPRPMVQMSIPHGQLIQRGVDKEYDRMVADFYLPYHEFIDVMMRSAVANNIFGESLIKLSCLVATEAIPLHFNLFAKFWIGMYANPACIKYVELLISSQNLVDYVDLLLKKERQSLNDSIIRNFMEFFYPKIASRLAIPRIIEIIGCSLMYKEDLDELCGDLHAIRLIAQLSSIPTSVRKPLKDALNEVLRARSALDYDKDDTPPKKKAKVNDSIESPPDEQSEPKEPENTCENPLPSTSAIEDPKTEEENISEIDGPKSPKPTESEQEPKTPKPEEVNGEVGTSSSSSKEEADAVDIEFSIKGLTTEETQKCFQRTINNFIRAILGIITAQDEPPPSESILETNNGDDNDPGPVVSNEEPLESSSTSIQSSSEVPVNTSLELSPSKVN